MILVNFVSYFSFEDILVSFVDNIEVVRTIRNDVIFKKYDLRMCLLNEAGIFKFRKAKPRRV